MTDGLKTVCERSGTDYGYRPVYRILAWLGDGTQVETPWEPVPMAQTQDDVLVKSYMDGKSYRMQPGVPDYPDTDIRRYIPLWDQESAMSQALQYYAWQRKELAKHDDVRMQVGVEMVAVKYEIKATAMPHIERLR